MKKYRLFLCAALLPILASAQIKVEIDGIYYNLIPKAKLAEVTFKGDSPYEDYEYSGSITIPATVTYNGVECNVKSIGKDAFLDLQGSEITSITIPESVTSIGERAFAGCKYLRTITIPKKSQLTKIKEKAFINCESLTSITIPKGVTSIGEEAFCNCRSLTSIIIPEGVKSIGDCAFDGCNGLTSITIPEGVTSIGKAAFRGCSKLTSINIPESSHLIEIQSETFARCSSLTAITLPKGVTGIGFIAFLGCKSLTSIIIPEGVTSIGERAFYDCASLTTIVLPKNLSDIYGMALANCLELRDVYCYAETEPNDYHGNAFAGSFPEYMTLHVPANALNAYESTGPWSSFGNIVTIEETETWSNIGNIVAIEGSAASVDRNGASFSKGIYAVDLGLSVKWASCNIGAESPEEYGDYYAWGETEEKSDYGRMTYNYSNTDGGFDDIGSNISGTSYDVAHVKLGSGWRMPTEDEIKELCKKCSWEWTEVNGVKGYKVTGPNGNSIFLPAAGFRYSTTGYNRGSYGHYWSATLLDIDSNNACVFSFDSAGHVWSGNHGRVSGLTVRPVTE